MDAVERNDLLVSWLTISIAFAWLMSSSFLSMNFGGFAAALPVAMLAVGTAFIFHELAHRQVARKFGAWAEYRAWTAGLVFALASALFLGIIFAAPGAVYIHGNINTRKNGLISIAGPGTNIVLGFVFLIGAIALSGYGFGRILGLVAQINFLLGLFNLLPFGPLDGKKVLLWSPAVWAIALIAAGIGFFVL